MQSKPPKGWARVRIMVKYIITGKKPDYIEEKNKQVGQKAVSNTQKEEKKEEESTFSKFTKTLKEKSSALLHGDEESVVDKAISDKKEEVSAPLASVAVPAQEPIQKVVTPQQEQNTHNQPTPILQTSSTPIQKPAPSSSSGLSTSASRQKDPLLPEENAIEDDERLFGATSYIPFLCFFVLFARKDSKFATFHAWQGFTMLVIFLATLPVYFIFSFFFILAILFWIFYFCYFGLMFYGAFTAWQGRYLEIPVISDLARKFSGGGKKEEDEE